MQQPEITGGLGDFISLAMLRRRWKTCVATTALTLLMTGLYLTATDRTYEAEVRIVLQKVSRTLDGKRASKTYDKEFLLTQAETIRSPLVLGEAIRQQPSPAGSEGDTVEHALEQLRVNPLAGTDIIKVTYQATDAPHARDRLQAIVQSYEKHLRLEEARTVNESLTLLKHRTTELDTAIKAKADRIATLQTGHNATGLPADNAGNSLTVIEQESVLTRELAARLGTATAERVQLETLLDSTSKVGAETVLVRELQQPQLVALQQQRDSALREVQQIRGIYGDKHPARLAAEQQYQLTEQTWRTATNSALAELQQRVQRLSVEERAWQSQISQSRRRSDEARLALQEQEQLQSELKSLDELQAATLANLESAQLAHRVLQEGGMSIDVQVLDGYPIPDSAVWPQPVALLFVSIVLGMLAGVSWIVVSDGTAFRKASTDPSFAGEPGHQHEDPADYETRIARQLAEIQRDLLNRDGNTLAATAAGDNDNDC